MKAVSLSCDGCGAPVEVPKGRTVVCSYCGRELLIVGQATEVTQAVRVSTLTDQLLRGYTGADYGQALRTPGPQLSSAAWQATDRSIWAISAKASSSFGSGWSPRALVGPPRVFPRVGDIMGAWAPGTRKSAVEWVELTFPDAGDVERIRVFETCETGTSFAVTIRDGAQEELVWQRAPAHIGRPAQMLEIQLDRPRRIRTIRVYVANHLGNGWSEIDTVCLYSVLPLPKRLRKKPWALRRLLGCGPLGCALFGCGALASVLFIVNLVSDHDPPGAPDAPEVPTEMVQGAGLTDWNVTLAGMASYGTTWSSAVTGRSSEYSTTANAASRALGPPDVFPNYGDRTAAWAPQTQSRGSEWIEVSFTAAVPTRSVVVVETAGSGAISRIDDASIPGAPVMLWRGTSSAPDQARVVSLELPSTRTIRSVRVYLDTTRVGGWNEIDAIGLVPNGLVPSG